MMRRALGILLTVWLAVGSIGLPNWVPIASGAGLTAALSAADQRVIELVNGERAKVGLPALSFSGPLTTSARNYAGYMASANFFGHVGPDGSTLVTRNGAAGYGSYTFLGENLAAGQTTPEAAMAGWMASPGHRANILSPNAREIGVGLATGGSYGYYWVQEFGARPAAVQAPAPPAPSAPASPRAAAPASRSSRPAPELASPAVTSWTSPTTGYTVANEWLAAYRALGGVDNLGEPRSAVVADPANGGQSVQFFQRAVLEYHPENAGPYTIQRRLLDDILDPGADDPVSPNDAPAGARSYFPFSGQGVTGLGHFVADAARSGQAIYFKDYFDRHGGVDAFGYPKEEPKLRDGVWTQRFQAAVFEYHPENDREGTVPGTNVPYRNYRVQLALLGDRYIEALARPAPALLGANHAAQNLALDASCDGD